MQKRTKKTLSLTTQTLRTLASELEGAAGGLSGFQTACYCTYPTHQWVNTCLKGCVQ